VTLDLNPYLQAIEDELRDILAIREEMVAPLYQMMHYHLGWRNTQFAIEEANRGKRLRPLFCVLACEASGGDWRRSLGAAAAIELVHNFSLLHDDIEDDSPTRRHRATVWSLWGIPQGINTGDGMWAIARLAVHRVSAAGYGAEQVMRVSYLLDEACLELCTGQYLDISFESAARVSLAQYERMIAGKTAALLSASFAIGATLGGAAPDLVQSYHSLGRELGLTFQISDDILGIWGNPAITGKSAATDILTRKKTLPLLYALRWEEERGYDDLARFYTRPTLTVADVPAILQLLARAGALEYARGQAQAHQQGALQHLLATRPPAAAPHLPASEALQRLAHSLMDRAY
jgi:geranylgeranyl diphosphate synthase, type I